MHNIREWKKIILQCKIIKSTYSICLDLPHTIRMSYVVAFVVLYSIATENAQRLKNGQKLIMSS